MGVFCFRKGILAISCFSVGFSAGARPRVLEDKKYHHLCDAFSLWANFHLGPQ